MGYVGAKLEHLFVDDGRAGRAARGMAKSGGDFLVHRAKAHSPVGKPDPLDPGRVPGTLRESWYRKRLRVRPSPEGHLVYESGAATDVSYAPMIEHGWGLWGPKHSKYPIVPKKPGGMLRFFWEREGRVVYMRAVMHPGAKGQPMIAPAVLEALAAWPSYLLGDLDRFMAEYLVVWEREAARSRALVAAVSL